MILRQEKRLSSPQTPVRTTATRANATRPLARARQDHAKPHFLAEIRPSSRSQQKGLPPVQQEPQKAAGAEAAQRRAAPSSHDA